MEFITDNATPLLWGLGILQVVGLVVIWPCLVVAKRAGGEE